MNALPWSMLTQIKAFIREKSKFVRIEKREKLQGFSVTLSIANFEAFCWNILMSINFLFLKSVSMCKVTPSF